MFGGCLAPVARVSGDEPSILNGIRQAVVDKSGTVKPFDLQKATQTLKIKPEELNSRVRPLAAEFLQALQQRPVRLWRGTWVVGREGIWSSGCAQSGMRAGLLVRAAHPRN